MEKADLNFSALPLANITENILYNIITDMEIDVKPGRYMVAVSGGVDSMALLDLLHGRQGVDLIVAHFDHGIRQDSAEDRKLVQAAAARYGLPFIYEEGKLGTGTSEETARAARYAFLERAREEQGAEAVITAHHQDDALETAILNILRGTGRKGLTSLSSRPGIIRPLLHISKRDILTYAKHHGLVWREDSTNADDKYLRNYIRHRLLPRFDPAARNKLLAIVSGAKKTNEALDTQLLDMLHMQPSAGELDRQYFSQLPHDIAKELLASWLRTQDIRAFDARTLERVAISAKTQRPGSTIHVIGNTAIAVGKKTLALNRIER